MDIKNELKVRKEYVDNMLDLYLPKEIEQPEILFKAMRYSVFAGGKRLRPIFLLEANKLFGGTDEMAAPYACAIEMIHTYSLIHDDLPALDNDNFRRGRLTCHKAFGEDMAILAGDALLSHSFEIMVNDICSKGNKATGKAMQAIAFGAGVNGMIVGQVVDVISAGKVMDIKTLDYIHLNKTAAMIKGAFKAGGIIGGANEDSTELLNQAGEKIGIAFQIRDDILDVVGSVEEMGKPTFSDEKNKKQTYVSVHGVEKSIAIVKTLSQEAVGILESFGERSKFLVELTKYLIDRRF